MVHASGLCTKKRCTYHEEAVHVRTLKLFLFSGIPRMPVVFPLVHLYSPDSRVSVAVEIIKLTSRQGALSKVGTRVREG
jgi:hypothetical protein